MRTLWVWVLIAACNDRKPEVAPPPVRAPAPTRADAAPIDAAPALPAEFPVKGGTKAAGTLAGKPFALAKAQLRLSGNQASLNLYSWVDGGACDPQFAPGVDQLYVSFDMPAARAVTGATFRRDDDGVTVTYKRPTLDRVDGVEAQLVLDEVTVGHATGRILLTDPKGTHVAGSFNAVVCGDPQTAANAPPVVDGVTWGDKPELSGLPAKPVSAILLGTAATPAAIEMIDWQDGGVGQHELHFFMTKPDAPCAFDLLKPGFKIGLPAIKTGARARTELGLVTSQGQPFGVVVWRSSGNVIGEQGDGWMAISIQSVTASEVRGRLVAWFNDPSKSMIAGAFTATHCHVTP
ncbi:MAG TPA: hypothetical protein VFQ65_26760 [Kofleriaceae bacterium]|nr:hypothetical protein [Kofleriaceae bacterium]